MKNTNAVTGSSLHKPQKQEQQKKNDTFLPAKIHWRWCIWQTLKKLESYRRSSSIATSLMQSTCQRLFSPPSSTWLFCLCFLFLCTTSQPCQAGRLPMVTSPVWNAFSQRWMPSQKETSRGWTTMPSANVCTFSPCQGFASWKRRDYWRSWSRSPILQPNGDKVRALRAAEGGHIPSCSEWEKNQQQILITALNSVQTSLVTSTCHHTTFSSRPAAQLSRGASACLSEQRLAKSSALHPLLQASPFSHSS